MRAIVLSIVLSALTGCAQRVAAAPDPRSSVQAPMTPPAGASSPSSIGSDPTITDPTKYVAVLENERVRVLRYHDEPGARTQQHHHPQSVLYALAPFWRRLTFPDGTTREREFKAGDVMWVPEQTHIGENIGTTPTEVLLIEVKSK